MYLSIVIYCVFVYHKNINNKCITNVYCNLIQNDCLLNRPINIFYMLLQIFIH